MTFGDYIVYVDESGDHSLTSINPQNPVFTLVFCIVEKTVYRDVIVPSFQKLKFDFWGHDCVILHSHEIRKARGDFNILLNPTTRADFVLRLNEAVESLPFTGDRQAAACSALFRPCESLRDRVELLHGAPAEVAGGKSSARRTYSHHSRATRGVRGRQARIRISTHYRRPEPCWTKGQSGHPFHG